MKERTLKFDSIIDLIDFETEIKSNRVFVNRTHLIVIGSFTDADVELAKRAYHATLIDNDEEIRRDANV